MRRRRLAGRGAYRGGVRAGRTRRGGTGGLPGRPPHQRRARIPLHVEVHHTNCVPSNRIAQPVFCMI